MTSAPMGKFEKAFLCELENPMKRVDFQFNPTTISFTSKAHYARNLGLAKGPKPQFVGARPTELHLDMLLDAMEEVAGTVEPPIQSILAWTLPGESGAAQDPPSPPLIRFVWGALTVGTGVGFVGHIEHVTVNYLMFSPDGRPLRATVKFDMTAPDEESATQGATKPGNPTSGARRTRRLRQLHAGESLQQIAYQEYGDPALWRPLAAANAIDDPFRLATGQRLNIPARDELEMR